MNSKEAFIKLTEYMVNIFNQRRDKNLAKDYFYSKNINFSINEFPIYKILEDLEMIESLKKCYYASSVDSDKTLYKTSYGFDNPQAVREIGEWLENGRNK